MTKWFPLQRFTINGQSMFPTLKPGQDVLVFNWCYLFSKPKIGDIVVIRKNGKDMIKRIQKVTQSVIPTRRFEEASPLGGNAGIQLKVFVQGDNREESTDSRDFGLVDTSQLLGKVIWCK